MSTVFNEESHKLLLAIKHVAKAVSATTTSSTAGLKDDDTSFTLSRSLPEVTAAIKEVGNKMLTLLDKFEKAVEEQLVTFYRTMKQNVENEHQILRTTKSLMPSDPSLLKHLVTATQQELQTATASYLVASGQSPRPVSPKIAPLAASKLLTAGSNSANLPPIKSPRRLSPTRDSATIAPNQSAAIVPMTKDTVGIASESLKSWLFVTLQSTMQLCEASRGAVYIRANEGTAYLRRVCGINAEERLPLDVSPAAGSTIATVVQNSIGVNIGRSRFKNPYALDNYSTASQAVRASVAIKITTGLILPIGDVGCILVADKTTESLFSELDEHILWSASMMIRGALKRYPVELLTGKLTSTTVHALNAHAMLPPIAADAAPYRIDTKEQQQLLELSSGKADVEYVMSPEEELQALCPGIVHVPRLPKKLVMIRANERGGFQSILSKDLESLKRAELSDEDLLEAAVPYITNLEALWRKSIDSMTELRSTCEKLDKELSLRNTRIVELEVEVRVLTRQYSAMRADVHRIRQAVPALLRDNSEPHEVVDDSKANIPTGRPSRKNTTVQPTPPQVPLLKKTQPPYSAR